MEKALWYLKMVQGKFSAKLKIILVVELARLTFKFSIYIVRERPILFIFNRSKKKFILFVLKIIVHFPSISFLFSLNDFGKLICSVKKYSIFQVCFSERSILFLHRSFFLNNTLLHKIFVPSQKFCLFKKVMPISILWWLVYFYHYENQPKIRFYQIQHVCNIKMGINWKCLNYLRLT